MAIDKGIAITCADLQQVGGLKHILLRTWDSNDEIVYGNGAGEHDIDSILNSSNPAEWYLFEFKNQEANMTVNATRENGSTTFECGLSFTLPRMKNTKFHELQNLITGCGMMGIAVDGNGTPFVIGVSEKYANSQVASRSQTQLHLQTMEGGSGSAYTDQNGITVNLMAKQYELPREYIGTIAYYTDATPSALYKATTAA